MRSAWLALCLGLALGLAACGGARSAKPLPFEPSTITPAATGEVAIKTGPNGNTELTITVRNLAPPERVKPGATVYVVWATELAPSAPPRDLGALLVDANLQGRLRTVTPLRTFDLKITAEPSPTVEAPSEPAVLQARIIQP